ncbi:MAG TPA: hypothetical protein VJQ57_09280 [Acidimicrobiia bacterium]|nr:hypothetical protein [Acidimicrobiia bacterium]
MATGALTLLEAAKHGHDQLKKGVIETIIQESPIIERIPWTPFAGNALQHNVEDTLPSVAFRDVGETYTASHGTDTSHFWGVAILGGEVKVDNFLVNVTDTLGGLKAKQYAKMAKANAMRFDFEFFEGDGTSKGFKGVKTLIDEGFGQEYVHSATGAVLSLESLDQAYDLFRSQATPDALLINRTCRRKITSLARADVTGTSMVDFERNSLGKQVMSWNGVSCVILGDVINGSGTVVAALPFTEDPGDGGSDTCSAYFVKWGSDDVTGLLGHGGDFSVRDFGETEAAPQHLGRLEWYPGIAIFNKYSIVRVSGILAA